MANCSHLLSSHLRNINKNMNKNMNRPTDTRPAGIYRSTWPLTLEAPHGHRRRQSANTTSSKHGETAIISFHRSNPVLQKQQQEQQQQRRSLPLRRVSTRRVFPEEPNIRQQSMRPSAYDHTMTAPDTYVSEHVQTATPEEGYAHGSTGSFKAVRIGDAVAKCLDEMSPSVGTTASSRRMSRSLSGASATSSTSQYASSRLSRQTANRRSIYRNRLSLSSSHGDDGISECQTSIGGSTSSICGSSLGGHESSLSGAQVESRKQYPCPFRRRNPARFNIREYAHCATAPFYSLSDIRHHIATHHRQEGIFCRRCKVRFESEAALDSHATLPKEEMCETAPSEATGDPEDGVLDDIARRLTCENAHIDLWTWEGLCRLIFPDDEETPSSDFYPVVELAEIEQEFDDGQEALKASLKETLRLLLPNDVDDSYCHFLAGQLELVFDRHRANTMRQCLSRFCSLASGQVTTDVASPGPQQAAITRRQTRRSRRNTLLHGLRPPSTLDGEVHSGSDEMSPPSTRTRTDSDTTQDDADCLWPPQSRTQPPPMDRPDRSCTSETEVFRRRTHNTPTRARAAFESGTSVTGSTSSREGDYNNQRDSRDSGIGIPCDVCEFESCKCTNSSITTESDDWPLPTYNTSRLSKREPSQPHRHSVESPARFKSIDFGSHNQTPTQRSLRHQPRLRVLTRGIDDAPQDSHAWTMSSDTSATLTGDSFSPHSFKQRVLMKRGGRRTQDGTERTIWTA
ncbi:hypothetical protein B0T22DRAFT_34088 [Podospora appendiculata]|uniref:C2H2-type domain-containing protein n=1 Tax=Podospora appendiculata TaxID=314037 RepID=A0AAE0XH42_9PEZI|nr:hypothetical protein B0T22DRAFT_34088 [Podospora appendiculata]